MLFARTCAFFAALCLAGHVAASPLPLIRARSVEKTENLVVRDFPDLPVGEPLNEIPAELPVRSDGINIEVIVKRQTNDLPAQIASQSDGGAIVPFAGGAKVKRQETNNFPAQNPSKSDGGAIVPFAKRQATNNFPAQNPSKSDGGAIVPFKKRDVPQKRVNLVPSHMASRSDGGDIVAF
ncbi:hypothetical protein FRC03_008758 [Tulasnella sp. 419]|nr:hypothetical protein FRC03_008758 [Tulasnella sp. 419]